MAAVDGERLAELGRAAQEVARYPGGGARGLHDFDARDRRRGAEQDGRAPSFATTHGVGAPVHAVGEVHVQVAGRAEHHLVARRRTPEGVASGVLAAGVGLDLDDARDARGQALLAPHHKLVQKRGSNHA